jgi:outer membrane protein insertion porin family
MWAWRVCLAVALVATAVAGARADVARYLGQPIASVRLVSDGRPTDDARLLEIIETRVGRPLSMSEVRESIAHLFSLGRFENVVVHADAASDGVALRYELVAGRVVTGITLLGAAAHPDIDAGRLWDAIRDRFGRAPAWSRGREIARFIEEQLRLRGYLRARANVLPDAQGATERGLLVVQLEPGYRARLGSVTLAGPASPEASEAMARLGLGKGDPYEPEVLATRIERQLESWRRDGYYQATLTLTSAFEAEDRTANLTLRIDRGPRVRLQFTGDTLTEKQRDELVPIAREGSADEDLLEDGRNAIESELRGQGYRDATAPYERLESNGDLVITFDVRKGSRYTIGAFGISGDAAVARAELETGLLTRAGAPFSAAAVDRDVTHLEDVYRRKGFASVEVQPLVEEMPRGSAAAADTPLSVRMLITEGPQTIVGSVRVAGNASMPTSELVAGMGLQPGQPFFATQMAVDQEAIQLRYANLGYPDTSVESSPGIVDGGTRADVVFTVHEGPRVRVAHVLVVGNERTSTETIVRELGVRSGDPLGLSAISESQRRLVALGLFRRVRITELTHGDRSARDLVITVDEAPVTTIGYGGGVEAGRRVRRTEAGGGAAVDRFEVAPRAFFEVTRRNILGKNRSVSLFTRLSLRPQDSPFFEGQPPVAEDGSGFGFSEYRILGTFREPRVFDRAADAFVTGTIEQQIRSSFNFARRGFSAEVGRIAGVWRMAGSYQIQRTELFDERIDPADRPLIDRIFPQIRLSSISATLFRDTRSDQLDPGDGHYLSANGQLAGRVIGSEVGFAKSYLTAQLFRTVPGTRAVVATSARIGVAAGFPRQAVGVGVDEDTGDVVIEETGELPASERFFAGGDTTVRGFLLDQLGTPETIDRAGFAKGGNGVVILNAELRARARGGLTFVGFVDAGNVFQFTTDIDVRQLRGTAGFGVRYNSLIGPLRFDYGFKMSRHVVAGRREDPGAWYISLGQAF